jgi:CxxC-x17-CxxC domain-containing protein
MEYNWQRKKVMGDYNRNRNNRSGGGGRFRGRDSRRRDSGPREMHKAICDECGKECEVPFKPSGDKPIYCSSCFEKREAGGSRRPSRRDSGRSGFGRRDDSNKQLLAQASSINAKLDRILKVLEGEVEKKPAPKKPVSKKPKIEKVVEKAPIQEVIEEKKESKKKVEKVEEVVKETAPKEEVVEEKKESKKEAEKITPEK